MKETKRPHKKIWRRVLAVVLAISLILPSIVAIKTEIDFSKMDYVEETARFAASYTEDTTGYLTENRLNRAWSYLQTLVGEPETYEEYDLYASLAIAKNDFKTAAKYLEGSLQNIDKDSEDSPDPAVLNLRLASLYVLEGQYKKADRYLDKAIALNPDLAASYYLKGQLAAQDGDTGKAVDYLKKYAQSPGADPAVTASLAEMFEGSGDYETAKMCYTKGIEADPKGKPELYTGRARCLVLLGDMDAAEKDLKEFFKLAEKDPDGQASAMMALCMMEKGDYDGATTYFRKAVKSGYKDSALLYSQLVKSCFAAGKYEKATEAGLKAIELIEKAGSQKKSGSASSADVTEVRFWTAMSFLGQNKYTEAKEQFEEVKKAQADYPEIDYYYGVCVLALEDYEKAETSFTASINKGEDLTECYYNRGVCRIQLGRAEEAQSDLREVVKRDDDAELKAQADQLLKAF